MYHTAWTCLRYLQKVVLQTYNSLLVASVNPTKSRSDSAIAGLYQNRRKLPLTGNIRGIH